MIELPDWLAQETFRIEHCPNCPSPYLVRLVQYGRGTIEAPKQMHAAMGRRWAKRPRKRCGNAIL